MKFIADLKLKQKLALLVIIPTLIMFSFGMYQSYMVNSVRIESQQLEAMVKFSVFASNLVHELQKERGMTAGFIGSKGSKFGAEIKRQRQQTDDKLAQLKQFLQTFDTSSIGSPFTRQLDDMLARFDSLSQKRSSVDRLQISLKQALTYYTGNNTALLNLIEQMSTMAPDKEVAIMIAAYANFLQGKERAGIERAVLANVFSKNTFTGNLFHRFLALVTTQKIYTDVFISLAQKQDINFYRETMSGEFITETQRMRDIAIENSTTGDFGIDAGHWFKMQTGKINLLKKVEDHLATGLSLKALEIHSSTVFDLAFTLIVSLLGFMVSIFLSILISGSLRRQIGGEPVEIERIAIQIADGKLQKEMFNHQTSGIYAAMMQMQQKLCMVIQQDIQNIVDAARRGDLTQRIELDDKQGFYRTLSEGVNDLVESSESIIQDTGLVFAALARGDLNQQINNEYQGAFQQLKLDANATIDKLKQVIEGDIQTLVDAALRGDLSQRIDLNDKQGFFYAMSASINQLVESVHNIFNDASRAMRAMAEGDLTRPLENQYTGQFEELKNNINETIRKLEKTITGLRDSSNIISSTAREISDGNNSLSARTEHQASALEETASSMEELTSTVKHNAENTQQADQLADRAKTTAMKGGEVMQQASIAMEEINQSSQKIAEIIGVIDEIAFQTNLLALNASVEAARAGEQGRGFAVVATEVRNLAGRSATAAKEIKELINDSVSKVGVGVKLVEDSTLNQQEIVESINRVGSIIAEISAASREQSEGIEQINTAVTSMDDATQQNAALAEQTSAAAISLSEQTTEMSVMMDFFRVSESTVTRLQASTATQKSYSSPASQPSDKKSTPKPVSRLKPAPKTVASPSATPAAPSFDDDEWEEF